MGRFRQLGKKRKEKVAQIVKDKPHMLPITMSQDELPFEPDLVPNFVGNEYDTYNHMRDLSKRDNTNTRDWKFRKIEDWIPVFVYGSLKSGGWLHNILKDSFWLGDATTALKEFAMWDSGSGFPVVRDVHKDHEAAGRIVGELYMVDPVTLLELDRVEGNNYMYSRRQAWVWAQDHTKEVEDANTGEIRKARPAIHAWVYVGMNDFWRGHDLSICIPKKINGLQMYDWDVTKRG